jgi:hypothetical protein
VNGNGFEATLGAHDADIANDEVVALEADIACEALTAQLAVPNNDPVNEEPENIDDVIAPITAKLPVTFNEPVIIAPKAIIPPLIVKTRVDGLKVNLSEVYTTSEAAVGVLLESTNVG